MSTMSVPYHHVAEIDEATDQYPVLDPATLRLPSSSPSSPPDEQMETDPSFIDYMMPSLSSDSLTPVWPYSLDHTGSYFPPTASQPLFSPDSVYSYPSAATQMYTATPTSAFYPLWSAQTPSFASTPNPPTNTSTEDPWGQAFSPVPFGQYNLEFSPMAPNVTSTPSAETILAYPRPLRGFQNPSSPRKRASTMQMAQSSPPPATPQSSGFSGRDTSLLPPAMIRRLSAPLYQKRVFHPSPAGISPALNVDLSSLPPDSIFGTHPRQSPLEMQYPPGGMEMKPPRFRPTKEQLDILVRSYEENKNPDAATREALAKRLGPEVRPKTLQIWFQNRRSKSRARDRDSTVPKPLTMKGHNTSSLGHRMGESFAHGYPASKPVDRQALLNLVHDDDPSLILLPITVLSIASWTRFLTPGIGVASPDLVASLKYTSPPLLSLYVVHKTDTFRISIELSPTNVTDLQAAANRNVNQEAVAVRFHLSPEVARYASWRESQGRWEEISDFTGGDATSGGRCELTGDREILLQAFAQAQHILRCQAHPTPMTAVSFPAPSPLPITPFPHDFRFPASTYTSRSQHLMTSMSEQGVSGHHKRQRSFSQPSLPDMRRSPWLSLASPELVIPSAGISPAFPWSFGPSAEQQEEPYAPVTIFHSGDSGSASSAAESLPFEMEPALWGDREAEINAEAEDEAMEGVESA
ncbi:hypothetical protein P7C73_g521, partial [Tremellales sp. Uapishka_1]